MAWSLGRASWRVAGLACIGLAALAAVAFTSAVASSRARLSTAGIPAATRQAFSVFSSDPGPHVRSAVGSPLAAAIPPVVTTNPFGAGARRAAERLVTVSASVKVLVLAGPHGICIGAAPAGSPSQTVATCNSTASALRTGIGGTIGGGTAFGIVPDGNRTVTIATHGRTLKVPVVANVYYATGLHGDRGISFRHH